MDNTTIRSALAKLWNETKGLEDITIPAQECGDKLYQKAYLHLTRDHKTRAFKVLYKGAPAILAMGSVDGVPAPNGPSRFPIESYGGKRRAQSMLVVYVWDELNT